jgi:dTDP-4-dehydrorhamnose reductase
MGVDRSACNITSKAEVRRAFSDAGPVDLAINAAAYTAVDQAESHAETAFAVNRDGAGNLAEACRQQAIPLVHISSDFVFEGLVT